MIRKVETNPWFVLKTRSRKELVAEQDLMRKEVKCFVPSIPIRYKWRNRIKTKNGLLYPGYVFIQTSNPWCIDLEWVRGSCGLLMSKNKPGTIPLEDINSIRIMIGAKQPIKKHNGLQVGDKVRVVNGPLIGVTGIFLREKNEERIVINTELFGSAVSTEVESRFLLRA